MLDNRKQFVICSDRFIQQAEPDLKFGRPKMGQVNKCLADWFLLCIWYWLTQLVVEK